MKITIAKDAGYCFGVRDAVNLAYKTAEEYGEVYMLGDIVHNENVIHDLDKSGAKVVDDINEVPKDKPILLRAHGTKKDIWVETNKRKMNVVDATCPLVHEIHNEVKKLAEDGRQIFVIGDHGHDEVIAIADQVPGTIVIASKEEARKVKKYKKAGVVSQSTQTIENVQEIINILMQKVFDLHFVNTICYPTKRNQEQIKTLAVESDVMLIIGSFTSANSKRLTLLSKLINKNTYQVTSAKNVKDEWFDNCKSVGISAGASTPDYLIKEVREKLLSL